jgi:hypothetical protein
LLKDCKSPEDLLGQCGLLKELTKGLLEKVLDAVVADLKTIYTPTNAIKSFDRSLSKVSQESRIFSER